MTCSDVPNQSDVQALLRANPTDPNGLDPDRDGIACEGNGGNQDRNSVSR